MVDANTTPPPPPPAPPPGEPLSRSPLVQRVANILMRPKAEWEVIDAEPATIKGLYVGYAMILAAIPPLASMIGSLVFGTGLFGIVYRPPIIPTVVGALVQYGLSLLGVAIIAIVIDLLAPSFGGVQNRVQAFKVAVYAMTAAWVAGIFAIVPMLAILGLLGFYSLYLLYLGLPRLMRSAPDKALGYTAVVVVIGIVIQLVAISIGSAVIGAAALAGGAAYADRGSVSGKVNIPGVGSVDVGQLEKSARALEEAADNARDGGAPAVKAVDGERLAALLPASVAGLARGEVSTSTGGVGGLEGSEASAEYAAGDSRIRLQVTDMGGAAAFGQMASAFNVRHSERSGGRYEKVETVDGRLTMEKYDSESRSGEYSVMIAQRFMVQADGDQVSMPQLRQAVESVGFGRLEALAKSAG